MATPTKDTAQIKDWNDVTAEQPDGTADIDVSALMNVALAVVVCPIEAVAHENGVRVVVEERVGDNDEDWRDLYEIRLGAGTAKTIDVDQVSPSGAKDLFLSATGDFDDFGVKYFVHDTVDEINSEIVRGNGADLDVKIFLDKNLTNTIPVTADIYDIVAEKRFPIPDGSSTVRVYIHNDDVDCDICWRVDLVKMTAFG